jgi:hypothetical protein
MAKKAAAIRKPAESHQPELPRQLRDQISAADAIRADMGREPNGQPNEPEDPNEPPQEPREPEPMPPAPPAPQQEPPRPAAAAPQQQEEEPLEQRYRSQAGRLEQALRLNQQMHERMQHMENLIASMQARTGEQPSEPPQEQAKPPRPKLVTPEETEDFGEDLLNVVGKRAREEYAPEFEELAARIRRIEGRVEGATTVIERNQQQELYNALDRDVPNWRDLNRSDDFKLWLQNPDQYSGRRKHDMLTEAFSRHEASRVVAFFKGFLTEAAGLPQVPQARTPSAPPLPGTGNGSGKKPSLEDFAAPGRARSAPQELPPDKPIYTHAWIAKFMADKRTGKYRGRETDADAIERDIYQAQHEGRIQ